MAVDGSNENIIISMVNIESRVCTVLHMLAIVSDPILFILVEVNIYTFLTFYKYMTNIECLFYCDILATIIKKAPSCYAKCLILSGNWMVGDVPCELMSPTSYQTAPPRDN